MGGRVWEGARYEGAGGPGEGILWGMPGESRGTLRAALCACVELISSPCLPLFPPPSSLFRVPECWQRQRRARSPSGPGPAASSRPPTLSSLLSLSPCPLLLLFLSLSLSCFFLISSRVFLSLAAFLPLFPSVVSSRLASLRGSFSFLRCCVSYIPNTSTH